MRKLEVAMAMLHQSNAYLLQRRTGPARIGAVGLIGCFGGEIEKREAPHVAVAREVAEETNLKLAPQQYVRLGEVDVPSDRNGRPVKIHAIVFGADVPAAWQIEARDGEVVRMTLEEIKAAADQLTPAMRAWVFEPTIGTV